MKLKEHTRNQKRMYRIHKQDEKIHDLELMIGKLQQENKQLKEKIKKVIRMLEIQIEAIKVQPSDNALNDNMEIKQREKVINLLNEVSEWIEKFKI